MNRYCIAHIKKRYNKEAKELEEFVAITIPTKQWLADNNYDYSKLASGLKIKNYILFNRNECNDREELRKRIESKK